MDEQRLERALRQGPPFATPYAARPMAWESPSARRGSGASRLVLLVAVTALMMAALGTAIAAGSGWLRLPLVVDAPSIQNQDEVFEVQLHYYTSEGAVTGVLARPAEPARIRARLPAGWVSTGSGISSQSDGPGRIHVSFWTVDAVFIDPCDAQGLDSADPPMMRTLEGLTGAFTLWWSADTRDEWWAGNPPRDLPRPTRPDDETVSGFRARHLELQIPDTVDLEQCSGGRYVTWRNPNNVERRHSPGEVSRLWIVEVGRDQDTPPGHVPGTSTPLLVIDATSSGRTAPGALQELDELIESVRIEAPETP